MKKFTAILFVFIFLFLNFSAVRAQAEDWKSFESFIEKVLVDWDVPGAAVAVVKDDKIVYAKGFGVKEKGKGEKVNERTLFGVASNSKAFTATAIAILVDEGKLKWDDKVIKYLPDFKLADEYVTRELTIRDLLSHRNGLPAYSGDIVWWGSEYTRDEVIERMRYIQPRYGFRATYAYQNIPFIVAGQIIEKVSGKSWDDFVKERIFKPLGMNETLTSIRNFNEKTNKTEPHYRDLATGKVFPIRWRSMDNGAAAAGIISNVLEMTNWLRMQIDEGEFEGKRIVSAKNIREIQSPQTVIPFTNPADQPKLKSNFRAYGLGWSLREYAGYKMVSHTGWTDGQLSMTAFIPEKRVGIVVLTNIHDVSSYQPIIFRAFDVTLGLSETDWNSYFLKFAREQQTRAIEADKKFEAERKKDAKPSSPLSEYAGTYENELYGKIFITEENGKLIVRLSKSPTFVGDLEHWGDDRFRAFWRDPVAEKSFLEFIVREGKVQAVKMAMSEFIDEAVYEYRKIAPAAK